MNDSSMTLYGALHPMARADMKERKYWIGNPDNIEVGALFLVAYLVSIVKVGRVTLLM